MNKICLVGVGALGIRHLEGLLKASAALDITVVDPSQEALANAQKTAEGHTVHHVSCSSEMPQGEIDLAIIATTARHRAEAVNKLLASANVRAMILEKILFTDRESYEKVGWLLQKHKVSAWVNCPLRLMPMRREMRELLAGEPFSMHFNGGGQYGLMTNIMHYADYAAFLAGSSDFEVDTSMLGSEILESKRSGYKELQGSIALRYQNGSSALMTTLAHARVRRTTIASRHARAIFDEGENIAWIAEERNKWIWKEHAAPILFQSAMTGELADDILSGGTCGLPSYEESAVLHLKILEPVAEFLKKEGHTFDMEFPFT